MCLFKKLKRDAYGGENDKLFLIWSKGRKVTNGLKAFRNSWIFEGQEEE